MASSGCICLTTLARHQASDSRLQGEAKQPDDFGEITDGGRRQRTVKQPYARSAPFIPPAPYSTGQSPGDEGEEQA